jgi:hypothetical protein
VDDYGIGLSLTFVKRQSQASVGGSAKEVALESGMTAARRLDQRCVPAF